MSDTPPTNIVEQLRRDEGEKLYAYKDSRGYTTIGVGVCIDQTVGCGITPDESAYLLNNRLTRVSSTLQTHLPWFASMDTVRQAVLVNMTYNMGWEHLVGFHNTLTYMSQANWDAAATEMLNSAWATQVGDRANRLAQQLRTGTWQ